MTICVGQPFGATKRYDQPSASALSTSIGVALMKKYILRSYVSSSRDGIKSEA